MLPSKEKFQYYNCPFYTYDGSCDRPYCHFKHSDLLEKEKEGSPEPTDSEEECSVSCVCHSQPSLKKHTKSSSFSAQQSVAEIKENGISPEVSPQVPVFDTRPGNIPQYRPTPIVELQKRTTMEPNGSDGYAPTPGCSASSGALTYNPSDIGTLDIKQEDDSDCASNTSNVTLDLPVPHYDWCKKEEAEDVENKIKVEPPFEWSDNVEYFPSIPEGPVKIEYFPWHVIPIDPPSSPSVDYTSIKYEPVDESEASLSVCANQSVEEQPVEYTPCSSKRPPTSLEYSPSTNFGSSIKKIKLQYNPSNHRTVANSSSRGTNDKTESNPALDMVQWESESNTESTATPNLASYVPTDKTKLSSSSKTTGKQAKDHHSHSSSTNNHRKHEHKRSHSSHSSSSKKRQKSEAADSADKNESKSKKLRTDSAESVKKDGSKFKKKTENAESAKKNGSKFETKTESTESDKKDETKSRKHRTESADSVHKHESQTKSHKTDSSKKKETKIKKHRTDSTESAKKDETKVKKSTSNSKASSSSKSHSHSKSQSCSSSNKSKDREREKRDNPEKSSSKDRSHKSSSSSKSKHSSRSTSKSSSPKKSKESAKENDGTERRESLVSPPRDHSPAASECEDDSPDNVMEECYRIFEQFDFDCILAETMKPEHENLVPSSTDDNAELETVPLGGKKRIAYSGAAQAASKPKLCRLIRPVSKAAGQMMAERWRQQQNALPKSDTGVNKLLTDLTGQAPTTQSKATSSQAEAPQKTSAQSFGKGKPRVAHKVKEELLRRPIVNASAGDRIPCSRRQFVLDKFTDQCLKKFPTAEEAYEKAIELENACFVKSLSQAVYNNLFVSSLIKLKKNSDELKEAKATHQQLALSLDNGIVKRTVVNRDYNFKGVELYKRLTRYILSEEQLKQCSYPMMPENAAERGKALVYNIDKNRIASYTGLERECSRCHSLFYVNKHGMPKELSKDSLCIFHPKRAFPRRVHGEYDCYYDCCSMPLGAEGCESCKYHISEKLDINNLHGFVQTFEKGTSQASGVYALDCEMCITTEGSALTRVTVIDETSNVVYDTLVKPDKPILDYCTRYSGVDEDMLKNVSCTLRDVQSVLLDLFSKDTILIGHSLNSDLMVLKLIHYCVIDTSIVFPHREGLPKRRALKNVAKDFLFRLIQQEEGGHDSKEDAVACMDLMKLKVKEAAKLE